jgi:hypothetical protein
MGTLVVLDCILRRLLFIELSKRDLNTLEKKYENNIEEFVIEKGIDEKFSFNADCAHMELITDDEEVEIYKCNNKSNEQTRVYLTA